MLMAAAARHGRAGVGFLQDVRACVCTKSCGLSSQRLSCFLTRLSSVAQGDLIDKAYNVVAVLCRLPLHCTRLVAIKRESPGGSE